MAANRWSTEYAAADYKELQATTMAVDSGGSLALLAGRKYLALVKLDKPTEVAKAVSRQSKWEVSTAEWNPHISHENMFAIACNQRAELITWQESQLTTVQSLRAHTRIIGDVNWSPFDPNLLATCSVDNYTFIWDIRDCRKPAISLFSIAGASQVKWNKVSNNLIATSNEGDVRLWDHRRSTSPLVYLAAHTKKILGLDWNPTEEFQLATASQECTVKFWNISNARRVENVGIINSAFPVWRARYTPFGQGLVTVVLPQLRRGENSIFLWNLDNTVSPVHTFVGHTDVIWDFAWRQQKEDRDYQLVSWAKDYWLRIWKLDPQLQKLCGHDIDVTDTSDPDNTISEPVDILDAGNTLVRSTAADRRGYPSNLSTVMPGEKSDIASSVQPRTLQQEFSLVNINIPCVTVDEMDAVKRFCTVTAVSGRNTVKLQLKFPATYPYNSPPTFHLCEGTTVDNAMKTDILTALTTTSEQHVKRNRSCLEPCLRQLKSTLDACLLKDQEAGLINPTNPYRMEPSTPIFLPATNVYGSFQDGAVPFPRTSGARFCGAGFLVSFSRPLYLKRLSNPGEATPRSLSALVAYAMNPIHSSPSAMIYSSVTHSPSAEMGVSVSSYYYPDRKHRNRTKSFRDSDPQGVESKATKAGIVAVYDISALLPLNRGLAQSYVVDPKNIPSMCAKNANAAAAAGRRDLVQLWSVVGQIANPSLTNSDCETPWVHHPFGKKLLQSLMSHYTQIGDIQTVAMLCCMFAPNFPEKPSFPRKTARIADTAVYTHISGKWLLKPGGSPYHTIHPGDTNLDGWNLGVLLKTSRSNSWSDSLDDHDHRYTVSNILDSRDNSKDDAKRRTSVQFLDPKQCAQHDRFKKLYAEILYQWGLLETRTHILKFVKGGPESYKSIEFITQCEKCNDVQGNQCYVCKKYTFHCAICHIAVRGASNFCLLCGHGGHAQHMLRWFAENESCPVGCGCNCIEENRTVD